MRYLMPNYDIKCGKLNLVIDKNSCRYREWLGNSGAAGMEPLRRGLIPIQQVVDSKLARFEAFPDSSGPNNLPGCRMFDMRKEQ